MWRFVLSGVSLTLPLLGLSTQLWSSASEVRVFILAGQSNMDGRPFAKSLPEALKKPQPDVMFFWDSAWTKLEPGSTFRARPETRFGPEITFGRDMADAWPGEQVAIIKHAKGGTSLAVEWSPETGEHYGILLEKVQRARSQLAEQGQTMKIEGFVWMQGERDAAFEDAAAAYEDNFRRFIARIRQDLGIPTLPFVFGQIHAPTHHYPHREAVKQAQARVSRTVAQVRMVPTGHLELMDDVHYTAKGVMWLGRRFAADIRELLDSPNHQEKKTPEGNPRFSTIEYFRQVLREVPPTLDLPDDPRLLPEWREKVATRLYQILGLHHSIAAPLNPTVTDLGQRDGYRVERIVYTSEPDADVPGLLLIPDGVSADNPAPAVLCLHGNVPGAKDEVAGETDDNPEAAEGLSVFHDDYARDLAQLGFVTFAIDLRESGERRHFESYSGPPGYEWPYFSPWQAIAGMMAIRLGQTYQGLCIFDAMRALDYLETRPEVQKNAIGCVGFSAGATYAARLAVLDRRVKVVGISGTGIGSRQSTVNSLHRRRPAGLQPGFFRELDAELCLAAIAPTPMVFARDRAEGRTNPAAGAGRILRAYEGMGASGDLKIEFGAISGHVWHRDVVIPRLVNRLRDIGERNSVDSRCRQFKNWRARLSVLGCLKYLFRVQNEQKEI